MYRYAHNIYMYVPHKMYRECIENESENTTFLLRLLHCGDVTAYMWYETEALQVYTCCDHDGVLRIDISPHAYIFLLLAAL